LRKGGKQRRELCSRNKTLTKTQRIENHEEEEVDDKDDLLSYNPFSGVSNKNDKKVELSANDSIAARKTERNRVKDIGNEKINDESTGCDAALYDENQDIDKAVAMRRAQSASVSFFDDVKSLSQLFWHRTSSSNQNCSEKFSYRPCFLCDHNANEGTDDNCTDDEYSVLSGRNIKSRNNSDGRVLIQYITIPPEMGERDIVSADSLIPYCGEKDQTCSIDEKGWCKATSNIFQKERERELLGYKGKMESNIFSRRLPRKSDVEAEMLLLDLILEHVKKVKLEKRKTQTSTATFELDTTLYEDSDEVAEEVNECDDSLEEPYTQALPKLSYDSSSSSDGGMGILPPSFFLDDTGPSSQPRRREPIRPGDVIAYYTQIFVSGDKRGSRTATILSVDPNRSPILVLDNGEFLSNDASVKRIKVRMDGSLRDHPGVFRPIEEFKLKCMTGTDVVSGGSGGGVTNGVRKEAQRLRSIIQKNTSLLKSKAEADGYAPLDLLNRYGKEKATDEQIDDGDNIKSSKIKDIGQQDSSPKVEQLSTSMQSKLASKSKLSKSRKTTKQGRSETHLSRKVKVIRNNDRTSLFSPSNSFCSDDLFINRGKRHRRRKHMNKEQQDEDVECDYDGTRITHVPQCLTIISSQSSSSSCSSSSSSPLKNNSNGAGQKMKTKITCKSKEVNDSEVSAEQTTIRRSKNTQQQEAPNLSHKITLVKSASHTKANVKRASPSSLSLSSPMPFSSRTSKTKSTRHTSDPFERDKTTCYKRKGDIANPSSHFSCSSSSSDDDFLVTPHLQRRHMKKKSTHKKSRSSSTEDDLDGGFVSYDGNTAQSCNVSPTDVATKIRRLASSAMTTPKKRPKPTAKSKINKSLPSSTNIAVHAKPFHQTFRLSRKK